MVPTVIETTPKDKTFWKTTNQFLRNIIFFVQITAFFNILFFPQSVVAQNRESSVSEKQATYGRVHFQGNLEHDRLVECSGMDTSLANTNLLWAINDSGDGPFIYALGHDGSNRGRIIIHNADNRDWEGLATFFWQDRPMILIADFGDNDEKHNNHTLYVIEEPKVLGDRINESTVIEVAWKIVFSYPDNKHDAESVAVDTNSGKVLVLTKRDNPPLLYELPLIPPSLGDPVTALRLTELRNIPPPSSDDLKLKYGMFRSQPTDMDISPDGLRIVVLTYKHAYMFERKRQDSWARALKEPPILIPLPLPQDRKDIRQREAICFSSDGKDLFVTSEGKKAGLYRLEVK